MMLRWAICAGMLILAAPISTFAAPVTICEQPSGDLSVANILPGVDRDGFLRQAGLEPTACWDADSSTLPPRYKADPRDPTKQVTQRHRYRRGPGNTVIIDSTVQRPDRAAILRQFTKEMPPARRAAIFATPLGSNLHQALRDGDFALAGALMDQIAARVGTPQEVMTAAEVALVRQIARDYEADMGDP